MIDYENVQSSGDEFYMNHSYTDDYSDKSDIDSDIRVFRNQDTSGILIIPKTIDLYINNMHTA